MLEVYGIVDCLHGLSVKRMQMHEISGFSCSVVEAWDLKKSRTSECGYLCNSS
jgi:hypothetical protein